MPITYLHYNLNVDFPLSRTKNNNFYTFHHRYTDVSHFNHFPYTGGRVSPRHLSRPKKNSAACCFGRKCRYLNLHSTPNLDRAKCTTAISNEPKRFRMSGGSKNISIHVGEPWVHYLRRMLRLKSKSRRRRLVSSVSKQTFSLNQCR